MEATAKKNRFVRITPELEKQTLLHLHKELEYEINWLCMAGDGKSNLVLHSLKEMQEVLGKFAEFGYNEVRTLDEDIIPELVEAIGELKRRGLKDEIRSVLTKLLGSCNIPAKP